MKTTLKRKLQLRFVLLSMAALLLLQGVIVSFSIWHSYRNMVSKSDVILSQIREAHTSNFRYFSVKCIPAKALCGLTPPMRIICICSLPPPLTKRIFPRYRLCRRQSLWIKRAIRSAKAM